MTHRFGMNKKLVAIMAAALALAGCMKDADVNRPATDNDKEVTLYVNVPGMNVPSSRALDDAKEKSVSEVDVVIFSTTDGKLLEYHHIVSSIQPTGGTSDYAFTIKDIKNISNITIAVVANASVEVAAAIDAVAVNGSYVGAAKKDFLAALRVSSGTKWNTAEVGYWRIPMYGEVSVTGSIYSSTVPAVNLKRMLAKVDVINSATADFSLSAVHVVNYNTAGVVAPAWNPATGELITGTVAQPNIPSGFNAAACVWKAGNEQSYITTTDKVEGEIYLFESNALYDPAEDPDEENPTVSAGKLRLIIQGVWNGVNYYYPVDFTGTDSKYIPVLRNHRYVVTIEEANGQGYASLAEAVTGYTVPANVKVAFLVVNENDIRDIVWNNGNFLGTNGAMTIPYKAGKTFYTSVLTNVAGGWQIDTSMGNGTGITYDANGTGWLATVKDGLAADPRADLELTTVAPNGDTGQRTAYVHLKAGRLTHVVQVTQQIGPPLIDLGNITPNNVSLTGYVGAFWKDSQKGERLISMVLPTGSQYAGQWVVQVLDSGTDFSDDDILFQSWDGTLPDDDFPDGDTPELTAGRTFLPGSVANGGTIRFKIGLKDTWSSQAGYATRKVRYARVVVSFGTGYAYNRVIYLRQGETADYVLTGTNAAKFSPYDLTHPDYKFDNSADDDYKAVPARDQMLVDYTVNDYFTEYPSQGGAHYQWTGLPGFERRAYTPYKLSIDASNWYSINRTPAFSEDHETCPPGWRRPSKDEFAGSISTSAYVIGFYADGFFDRRLENTPQRSDSAVAGGTARAAYMGELTFNYDNNASLFFPFGGYGYNKTFSGHGRWYDYWTSTSYDVNGSYDIRSNFYIGAQVRSMGMTIRCVEDL